MADDESNAEAVHCVVDTDILLHFETFDQVDWPNVLEADHVHLVLTSAVMRELNQHKDDTSNAWRQKRARTLVPKLQDYLGTVTPGQPSSVRSGVSLIDMPDEPSVNWSELGLDPGVNDDRLIASILNLVDELQPDTVYFLSNDFLARRKAIKHGIEAIEPEGKIPELQRSMPELSELEQLRRENLALKNRLPRLTFALWEDGDATNLVTRSLNTAGSKVGLDQHVTETVREEGRKLEEIIERGKRQQVSEAALDSFSRECQTYLEDLEKALKLIRLREFGPACELCFVLENAGSAPARDVKIDLLFPEGFWVIGVSDDDEYQELRLLPRKPKPKWQKSNWMQGLVTPPPPSVAGTLQSFAKLTLPKGPLYDDDFPHLVAYEHPKLQHDDCWPMESVVVYFPLETDGGFEIIYSINSDDILERIGGKLAVRLVKSE